MHKKESTLTLLKVIFHSFITHYEGGNK